MLSLMIQADYEGSDHCELILTCQTLLFLNLSKLEVYNVGHKLGH